MIRSEWRWMVRQCRALAKLSTNWDGEGSPAPDTALVERLLDLLRGLWTSQRRELPMPFGYPLHGGGIQIEFRCRKQELELSIMADTPEMLDWFYTGVADIMEEGTVPVVEAAEDVARLVKRLIHM